MRISSFVPAIMAFTLFTATTQALPTLPHHERAVELLKRGGGSTTTVPSLIDAVVKVFVQAETKILVDACVDLKASVCADVDVKLNAKAEVLGGLIGAEVDVKHLEVKAKADVDADIKARIDLDLKAVVIANIDAHVRAVVLKVCPNADKACLKKNAHAIVAQVAALINIDIKKLTVKIKADLHAHAKLRLDLFIKKLDLNALGLAKVTISAVARVRAEVDVHLKAFVDICAKLLVNAKLIADIGAL
ncbi:hypothetical protein BG015_002066 [Linnemannia schmuckeri]|uniref:Uncharacterized protein n=1 Tax=Linnemannia schmuckeri TaxID=64567 RepID=A0A9P5V631_9FUNG|nr:hypothetical protein BG015_002066 [Linnemannia schmuckeri]